MLLERGNESRHAQKGCRPNFKTLLSLHKVETITVKLFFQRCNTWSFLFSTAVCHCPQLVKICFQLLVGFPFPPPIHLFSVLDFAKVQNDDVQPSSFIYVIWSEIRKWNLKRKNLQRICLPFFLQIWSV